MGASPLSGSAILKANYGLQVIRATSALPATTDLSIFTISTGRVIVTSLVGQVTTIIQAQANAIKIKSVPTTGTTKDISGTLDINAFEVGALITLDGTALSTTLSGTNAGAALMTRGPGILVPIGALKLNTAATNTGAIQWTMTYIPYDTGASVVAA
jgi:hypothetical protein